jgi:hypothetical protein
MTVPSGSSMPVSSNSTIPLQSRLALLGVPCDDAGRLAAGPTARVIVLITYADDASIFPALRAGAAGGLVATVAQGFTRLNLLTQMVTWPVNWAHWPNAWGCRCRPSGSAWA